MAISNLYMKEMLFFSWLYNLNTQIVIVIQTNLFQKQSWRVLNLIQNRLGTKLISVNKYSITLSYEGCSKSLWPEHEGKEMQRLQDKFKHWSVLVLHL